MTCATVKDNIVSFIQRSYRYGKDIAVPLRDLLTEVDNLQGVPPTEVEGETMVIP